MAEPKELRVGIRAESGQAVIEGLLAFGLVALVFAVGVQAFAYAHARSVAIAAAQDGARSAATNGATAGINRANKILKAAGATGDTLTAHANEQADEIAVSVAGSAPTLFPLSLLLPDIHTSASLPPERYPAAETAAP